MSTSHRQSSRSIALIVAVLAAVASFALFGASAGAQVYPPTTTAPGGLVAPTSVAVGSAMTVSGASCGAGLPVTVTFNGSVVATTTADANGSFSVSFTVPAADTPPGVYSVSATSDVCVLGAQVTVTAAGGNALAFTGSSGTGPAIFVGIGLLVVGGILVIAARRRSTAGTR